MTFPTTHPALARALAAREYTVPTAVQLAVLDAGAAGKDMLVSAQTGSGKTVAFGLAMATTVLGEAERFERAVEPLGLIIAPTRELALQVQRELAWLYAETGAQVVTCVGGMDVRSEARQLNFGAHIVVGTPGRLRDHLERKRLDLSKLRTVVLDEADEMLDLGFREDLEFILDAMPAERQTLLFSATMPREIEALARQYQREAIRIETIRRDEQHADIEYRAIRVASHDVEHAVVNVLRYHEMRATLVFCATREAVKRLHSSLVERGFSAVALSGELTQAERSHALQALRDGRARVLVATDVAARGLDLPDLALVIHADLPNDRETLLHRSGRTGRAGRKGLCTIIVPFNRRRKAEALLGAARLKVTWGTAPTADEIRVKDQERFLAEPIFTEPATEDDQALAGVLQAGRTADEIALALVRMHRAQLPAPEDLAEDTGPPRRDDRGRERDRDRFRDARAPRERDERGRDDRRERERGPRPERAARKDDRPMVWFRLNIGRDRNADPRWLLPLICKAGGVTKSEIGVIKIQDRDTRFQILAENADQFAEAARTAKTKEGHISRVGDHTPDDAAPRPEAPREAKVPLAEPARPEAGGATAASATAADQPRRERYDWKKHKRADANVREDSAREATEKPSPVAERPAQTEKWKGKKAADGGRREDVRPLPSRVEPGKDGPSPRREPRPEGAWKERKAADRGSKWRGARADEARKTDADVEAAPRVKRSWSEPKSFERAHVKREDGAERAPRADQPRPNGAWKDRKKFEGRGRQETGSEAAGKWSGPDGGQKPRRDKPPFKKKQRPGAPGAR